MLVNNAAVYPIGPWHEMDAAQWDAVFATNIRGYFLMARAVRPQMIARGGGAVVNVASVTFLTGNALLLAYVASKGAVIGFTRALAREAGPEGIRANAVAPGAFPTAATEIHADQEGLWRDVLEAQSIKRRGEVEDVARAIAFFAGDDVELRHAARRCWWTAAGCSAEREPLVVGARHVARPARRREVAVPGERAQPVARVVLAHDEDAIGLLDDRERDRSRAPTAHGHDDLLAAHLDRVAPQRDLRIGEAAAGRHVVLEAVPRAGDDLVAHDPARLPVARRVGGQRAGRGAALAQRPGLVRAQVGQAVEAPAMLKTPISRPAACDDLVRPGGEVGQPADDDLGHRRRPVRSIPKSSSAFSPKTLRRCSSLNGTWLSFIGWSKSWWGQSEA